MKLRKAVGAIILNDQGKIVVFQRADFPETWQCPEGGIDPGETPEMAMLRELREEIGLENWQFDIIRKTGDFIPYLFRNGENKYGFDGQEKLFFLVKIRESAPNFIYDKKSEEIEFMNHGTATPQELLELVPDFKKNLYRLVLEEFELL
ncbi:MAG: NUDIX domain-containing protein [Rickettsiales bacterium]|jgi:putative (di)nucleoside polyphosphate hydrolase|nr:NUDIX domain-containing protein [Rickettsiales bacterium]